MFGKRRHNVKQASRQGAAPVEAHDAAAVTTQEPADFEERFAHLLGDLDAALAAFDRGADRIEAAVAETFERAWRAALPGEPLPFEDLPATAA
jgi:hypothetical protein